MNKLFKTFTGLTLGLAMAMGIGAGLNNNNNCALATGTGITPTDNSFVFDFYDSSALSSSSGTALTNNNYKDFLYVNTGLTKNNVVTGVSTNGTVQYGKNGGLTAGSGSKDGSVTFSIGSDYAVNKCTVYATGWDSGTTWKLNNATTSVGSLASKGSNFDSVTSPLIWENLNGITSLTLASTAKRATIYAIICEYGAVTLVPSVVMDSQSSNLTLDVGETHSYSATKNNADNVNIVWSSSNTNVATIDPTTGDATACGVGTTTIKASITVEDVEYKAETTLTVLYPEPAKVNASSISEIMLSNAGDKELKYGLTCIIKGWGTSGTDQTPSTSGDMVVTDGNDEVIIYGCTSTSSKLSWDGENGVYTYDRNFNFNSDSLTKDLTIGSRLVLDVIRENSTRLNAIITDKTLEGLSSISVTPNKTEYDKGESISISDFTVEGNYTVSGTKTISPEECTISPSKFLESGNITVTVSYGGKSDTYNVTVKDVDIDITDIILSENTLTILTHTPNYQLEAIAEPDYQTEGYSFTSSDTTVATVDQNGVVTAINPGTAVITVVGNKGLVSDTCTVNVVYGATCSMDKTDEINWGFTGISSTGYVSFENKQDSSDAIFDGKVCKNTASGVNRIQFNKANAGVWTSTSGGLVDKIDAVVSGSNPVVVYGRNTAFTEIEDLNDADVIATFSKSGSVDIEGDYKYIYVKSTGGVAYLESMDITWNATYKATILDMNDISDFIEDYLDVGGEYDAQNNKGSGLCKSEGWYDQAKEMFNEALSDNQRKLFMQDNSYVDARARLIAWAAANGDSFNNDNNKLLMFTNNGEDSLMFTNNNSSIIVLVLATLSAGGLGILYLLKKKKHA